MTTRRNFLKQSGTLSAALLLTRNSILTSPNSKQLIGLQLYTLRNELSKGIKETIAKIAETGYNSVEVFGYNAGKFFGLTPEEFAAIFKANNLATPSGHYMLPNFLKKGDTDELKKGVEDASKMAHKYFTIPYLTDDLRTSLDDYKTLASRLNIAGEEAKKAGLKLAYHNHDFEFKDWGNGHTGFQILANETDHDLVHFEMDIYWVTKAGLSPLKIMDENPGRFKLWHVKDMANSPEKEFTEVGSGVIDYKEIFKHRKAEGIDYFFVEQDQTKIPPFESIAKSLAYVKENLVK